MQVVKYLEFDVLDDKPDQKKKKKKKRKRKKKKKKKSRTWHKKSNRDNTE